MVRKGLRWGAAILGVLVLWVAVVALAVTVAQLRVPVNLPIGSDVRAVGDSYVTANGTWVIEGQKQAYPLQTTEIWCEREMKRCIGATAQIMGADQMRADLEFYDVVSWEKSHVVFVDDSPNCVRYVYTIDLVTKFANGVRRKKPNADNIGGCAALQEEELRLSLKSGFEVVKALQKEAMPWFGQIALAPLKLLQ